MPDSAAAAPSLRSRRGVWLGLAGLVAVFVAIQLRHLGFVPLWDAGAYAECVVDAAARRDVAALNCFRHSTLGFAAPHALLQMLFPGSAVAMHLLDIAFGVVALLAFHAAAAALLPRPGDALLATALLAVHPVFHANVLMFTPDLGVAVGFTVLVAGIATHRGSWVVAAGLLLASSKETGAVLYAIAGVIALALRWRRPQSVQALPHDWRKALVWLLPLAIPALFLATRHTAEPGAALWQGAWQGATAADSFTLDPTHPSFRGSLATVFVTGFNWVPTLFLAAWALLAATRRLRRGAVAETETDLRPAFLAALFALGFLALSRHSSFVFPRYFLSFHPLLLLLFAVAAVRLVPRAALRRAVLAGLAVLFALSLHKTVDPVSKRLWGTFAFGNHELLHVNSITGQCCGYGRDGLTYNLEFTRIHELVNEQLRRFKPDPQHDVVGLSAWVHWHLLFHTDATTHERSLRGPGSYFPRRAVFWDEQSRNTFDGAFRRLLFLDLPISVNVQTIGALRQAYQLVAVHDVELDGYRLRAGEFVPRAPAQEPAPQSAGGVQ